MYMISIAMGRAQPIVWTLMFKTQERAEHTFKTFQDSMGEIALGDDFGQTINVEKANICSMLLEDTEQSKLAHVARGFHEQKIRAAILTRMGADHGMRGRTGGPAMLTPMGGLAG